MKETVDQTIPQWLRKWLGIDALSIACETSRASLNDRLFHHENDLKQALADLENTRQDLIQRMQDLSEELAQRKGAQEGDKPAEDPVVISPARKTFSQRRKEAMGSGRNMAAYLGKKKSDK